MWINRGFQSITPPTYVSRSSVFIDKDFQLRYTLLVVGASTAGMLFAMIPLLYFMNQNYEIFTELAYHYAPTLLSDLEREKVWMNSLLLGVFASLFLFFSYISYKMTSRIVGPIKVIKNHLKLLSRGVWHQNKITIRGNDEFQDLVEAYNYFYSSFQKYTQKDLNQLKSLSIDPKNLDAQHILKDILAEKRYMIFGPEENPNPYHDEVPAESHDSLHAS